MIRPNLRAFMPANTARIAWKADHRSMARMRSTFRSGTLEGGHVLNAGIIDEDVHLAEGVGTVRHHPLDGVRLAHVGAVTEALSLVLFGKLATDALDFRAVAKAVEQNSRRRRHARAIPSPIPLVEPVTMADLPARARTPAAAVCAVVVVAMGLSSPVQVAIERFEMRRTRRRPEASYGQRTNHRND